MTGNIEDPRLTPVPLLTEFSKYLVKMQDNRLRQLWVMLYYISGLGRPEKENRQLGFASSSIISLRPASTTNVI